MMQATSADWWVREIREIREIRENKIFKISDKGKVRDSCGERKGVKDSGRMSGPTKTQHLGFQCCGFEAVLCSPELGLACRRIGVQEK